MLILRPTIDSPTADIFATKCCSVRFEDANFELLVTNDGAAPVTVPSVIELEGRFGVRRIDNLMPHGERTIAPGETIAFYTYVDEALWAQATVLVMTDRDGGRHRVAVGAG